ncbi:MAG: cupin domain-containing protein [Armatimonadetes bacterium]|nr:cupin domain-containing protein [Armatimonadota bacterium]
MAARKWDWGLVAKRFRERRRLFGWSIDDVAARAKVSRDTVMRAEKGQPISDKSLHALRGKYAMFSAQLVPHERASDAFSNCPANQVKWMAATHRDHKGDLVKDIDYSFVDDPAERRRRAILGYQRFFTGFIRSELDDGVMTAGLMEIYQLSWTDQHYGEEFVYCLSGSATIVVDDVPCVLEPGDTMVFDALRRHSYAPTEGSDLPAVILFIVATRPNESERMASALPPRETWGV